MAPVKRKTADEKPSRAKDTEQPSKRVKTTTDKPAEKEVKQHPLEPLGAKSTLIAKEEKSFPRGGASVLSPLEYKEVTNEAARDVLFETTGEAAQAEEKASKKRKTVHKAEKRKGKQGDAKEEGEKGIRIESLSHKVCPTS